MKNKLSELFNLVFSAFSIILIASILIPSIVTAATVKVTINGIENLNKINILASLNIYKASFEKDLSSNRINNLHNSATLEIKEALATFGYYNPIITPSLTNKYDNYHAIYNVKLGNPVIVKNINYKVLGEGKNNQRILSIKKVLDESLLNKALNHEEYETLKKDILSTAIEEGFLKSFFNTTQIRVDRDRQISSIEIILNTHKHHRFSKVTFDSNKFSAEFLNKFVPFKEGDIYTTAKLQELNSNLIKSGFFTNVIVKPMPNLDNEQDISVPINVKLIHQKKNKLKFSLGISTDDKIAGLAHFEKRLDKYPGHKFNLGLKSTAHKSNAYFNYIFPGTNPTTDSYKYSINVNEENLDKRFSRNYETSFTKINQTGNLKKEFELSYLQAQDKKSPASPIIKKHFLTPSAKFTWTDTYIQNNRQFGKKVGLNLKGGLEKLMSSTNLIQVDLNAKLITPITDKTTFHLKSELGTTFAKDTSKIPTSYKYFAGGDKSLRGFKYKSIGIKEIVNNKEVVNGGRHKILGSAELERNIFNKEDLTSAIFFDVGNVTNKYSLKLNKSVGGGIRYYTPIGPIKLDIATPLNGNKKGKPRLHFTIGFEF